MPVNPSIRRILKYVDSIRWSRKVYCRTASIVDCTDIRTLDIVTYASVASEEVYQLITDVGRSDDHTEDGSGPLWYRVASQVTR